MKLIPFGMVLVNMNDHSIHIYAITNSNKSITVFNLWNIKQNGIRSI